MRRGSADPSAVVIGHMRHARFGLAAIGDVFVGLDQILRLAGFVEHGDAPGQEQAQAVFGLDRMFFGDDRPSCGSRHRRACTISLARARM